MAEAGYIDDGGGKRRLQAASWQSPTASCLLTPAVVGSCARSAGGGSCTFVDDPRGARCTAVAGTDDEAEAAEPTECDLTPAEGGSCETLSENDECVYVMNIVDNRDGSPDGTDSLYGIDVLQFADGATSHAKHLEHEATHLKCRTEQCVAKDNPDKAKCLHECTDVCPSATDE